ncbi:MAG: NADH-quinone oxidoreductase subunit NuoK [Thermoplasmata archaeon]|uniref:NADH-quinone oxidoreductase subunit NuoK n=1 Tax=Candidatus Sysuiplasma superficiale TaxID=2823368 RepID=A0A8J7YP27_9ARCH|nr:NADH-quinone oxidoreductase subunit NuoK [Candidatus Sysuiplasma superficiale]MBX8644907.1 NADH-quinone oxidoreductase subunit NuoK [Candidatus Sysuiplasma superficiale]
MGLRGRDNRGHSFPVLSDVQSRRLRPHLPASRRSSDIINDRRRLSRKGGVTVIQVVDAVFLSAVLFVVGVFGVLYRRNAIMILLAIELMLNAANINFVAFSNTAPTQASAADGQIFALISIAIAAAEIAVGLAILLVLWKSRDTIEVNEVADLRW